ncbi:MAG TPA: hypothetical protein VG672_18420 [Bryobacteraceae bacterium]|nr:hypothetical protein [Bryobacteraceae bacterium]
MQVRGSGDHRRLEQELAANLAPVEAPESAWARVAAAIEQSGPLHARGVAAGTLWWRIAACALLALAGGAFWFLESQPRLVADLEGTALEIHADLSAHPERLDLRTSDAGELRQWFAKGRIVAALAQVRPQPDPDALELRGARWIQVQGKRMAAVTYRVGNYPATLLIARARDLGLSGQGHLAPQHQAVRRVQAGGLELYSWQTGGQVYALVSSLPEQSQRACVLCHADPSRRQMILHMQFSS